MESEYDGSTLIRETHYKGAPSDWTLYRNVYYLYDENGSPFGMRVVDSLQNSYYYFYEKNLQGDIVAVLNEEGYTLASYTYDAWGNILSTTYATVSTGITSTDIAHSKLNPFRYRGYYYDTETELYYLQSRYYNASWGRFINPDNHSILLATPDQLTDKNLFAYCDNNPVMRVDGDGEFWLTVGIMAVGGLIGGTISTVTFMITQQVTDGDINLAEVLVAGASGFVSGAVSASPLGVVGQVIAGAAISGLTYVADTYANGEDVSTGELIVSTVTGGFLSYLSGPGANYKGKISNVIKHAKQVVQKELRRANQSYAQKAIATAISRRNNSLAYTAWLFAGGCILGNDRAARYEFGWNIVKRIGGKIEQFLN